MKTAALLAAASFLFATHALAQTPPSTPAPPPPGMNDPGVKAVAPAASKGSGQLDLKAPALPSMQDPGEARDAKNQPPPQVSVRREGDNTIQEYSQSGRVYMIVVTPKSGLVQTYMVDPSGVIHSQPGQPPVKPVMYKLLEWGKSPPAQTESTSGGD